MCRLKKITARAAWYRYAPNEKKDRIFNICAHNSAMISKKDERVHTAGHQKKDFYLSLRKVTLNHIRNFC